MLGGSLGAGDTFALFGMKKLPGMLGVFPM
jgi:hypothetical protein